MMQQAQLSMIPLFDAKATPPETEAQWWHRISREIIARAKAAGRPVDEMPSGQALIDYWLTHRSFGLCERKVLVELINHRKGLSADQLCQLTGYQFGGGFRNALGNLRTAGVLVGRNVETMRASDFLFE